MTGTARKELARSCFFGCRDRQRLDVREVWILLWAGTPLALLSPVDGGGFQPLGVSLFLDLTHEVVTQFLAVAELKIARVELMDGGQTKSRPHSIDHLDFEKADLNNHVG